MNLTVLSPFSCVIKYFHDKVLNNLNDTNTWYDWLFSHPLVMDTTSLSCTISVAEEIRALMY